MPGRRRCCCTGTPPPPTCLVTVCVTGCPSGSALVGATVAIAGVGSCTTVASGGNACCTLDIGSAGTETLTVSASGYITYTGSIAMTCARTIPIALQPVTAPASVIFTVHGCCGKSLPGANCVIDDQTCQTDSSGQCSVWIGAAGTYGYTISKDRFATASGSVTLAGCVTSSTTVSVTLTPASGYACAPDVIISGVQTALADPTTTTLLLTDSVYGDCTLTWASGLGASGGWTGTIFGASYPAQYAEGPPIYQVCPASTFNITYTMYSCAFGLSISYPFYACSGCTGFHNGGSQPCYDPAAPPDPLPACGAEGEPTWIYPVDGLGAGTYGGASCTTYSTSAGVPFDFDQTLTQVSGGCNTPDTQPWYNNPYNLAVGTATWTVVEL